MQRHNLVWSVYTDCRWMQMEKYIHLSKVPKLFVILSIFLVSSAITRVAIIECASASASEDEIKISSPYNCGKLDVVPTDIRSFAPFTVAIFRRVEGSSTRWKFHTTGTISTPGRVLSHQGGAPGRFPSDKDPRNFLIAAGINTTDFSKHDEFAQYSRVAFILPRITLYESFFHFVFYYLVTPLDFSTPFVKAPCPMTSPIPAGVSNPKSQFLKGLQTVAEGTLVLPVPVSGFVSTRAARYANGPGSHNRTKRREWTLRVWKIVALPTSLCASVFRFHYGASSSPLCFRRTFDNASSFLSGDEMLQQLKLPPEYSSSQHDHDQQLCLSHGGRVNFFVGGTWLTGGSVSLIPRQKWSQCDFNSVYFGSVSGTNTKEWAANGAWFAKVGKCGDDKFPCGAPSNATILKCITLNRTCDNIPDCEDKSDEHPDICAWKTGTMDIKKEDEEEKPEVTTSSELDPRDATGRCPDFEFILNGVRCLDSETLEELNCNSPFYPGRKIRVECDKFYRAPKYSFDHMDLFCNFEGEWSGYRPIHCQKECGVSDDETENNVLKKFPWEVTISEKQVKTCEGTLIQPTFVLTDGACVKNWVEDPGARSTFHITLDYYSVSLNGENPAKFLIRKSWVSGKSENIGFNSENEFENGVALIQLGEPVEKTEKFDLNKTMAACYLVPPFHSTLNVAENNSLGTANNGAGLFFRRLETATGKFKHVLQGILSGATKDGRGTFKNVDLHADWILDILENNS